MGNMIGLLIRQARLAQNLSQDGLAKGICAASYLSKIEQGQVDAGQEILDRLCTALGMRYQHDAALLEEASLQFDALVEAFEDDELPGDWFAVHGASLACSDACLLAALAQVLTLLAHRDTAAAQKALEPLQPYLPWMSGRERYCYYLAAAWLHPDPAQALALARTAEAAQPGCMGSLLVAQLLYRQGDYNNAILKASQCYQLAADEGRLCALIKSSFLLGNCYTNHWDLTLSAQYYNRAIRLSKGHAETISAHAWYNLGASYLERGDTRQALAYLSRVPELGVNDHDLLLHQKLALANIQEGRQAEADAHLARAAAFVPTDDSPYAQTLRLMQHMVTLRLRGGYLDDPAYESTLRRLYDSVAPVMGFGFRIFHAGYLLELLRHQRKYKEALQVMEEIHRSFL